MKEGGEGGVEKGRKRVKQSKATLCVHVHVCVCLQRDGREGK